MQRWHSNLSFREIILLMSILFMGWAPVRATGQEMTAEEARQKLVRQSIISAGIQDQRVIDSMLATPRHEFVPRKQRSMAYYDMSLPIGANQTISSPFIVAYMTESLEARPTDRVLEIGTGSGYQAAILSPLVQDVYTIEIVESLGVRAKQTLKRLGYRNVHTRIGDGYQGWREFAPYNKIIVTCSPEDVPQALVDQLAEGGRMVIPVGERYQQVLYLFTKKEGELQQQPLRPTLFVPMTGTAETERDVLPDGKRPTIANGSFESTAEGDHPFAGWFYQRQISQNVADDAPDGEAFAVFKSSAAGLSSHALQGFAIDGRHVRKLTLSAHVRAFDIQDGPEPDMKASLAVSFYDARRAPLGQRWIGPWRGNLDWQQVQKTIGVPAKTREAILRVGLFGATGELWVDQVTIAAGNRATAQRSNPP